MHPRDLKAAFDRGENITSLLRREAASETNTEEIIETAYDLQAGSYIASLSEPSFFRHKEEYGRTIASVVRSLIPRGGSVVEPGVGEGTTLSFVAKFCGQGFGDFHGFDISWSRMAKCREWLTAQGVPDVFLSVASIFHAPYADNSFDVVYTSHTIEPNGGQESPILAELYRIASKYLVLLEPGYELASKEAQERMKRLGYVTGLKAKSEQLGMRVVKHELFPVTANPLNPTVITIIEKNPAAASATPILACPRYRETLQLHADSLYSSGSMRAYPMILGIPCLRMEDGIVASQYEVVRSQLMSESSVTRKAA